MSGDKLKKKRGIKALFKKKEKDEPQMSIGTPYAYKQNFHVGFDSSTGQFQVNKFISSLKSLFILKYEHYLGSSTRMVCNVKSFWYFSRRSCRESR